MGLDIGSICETVATTVCDAVSSTEVPLIGYPYPVLMPQLDCLIVRPRTNTDGGQFVDYHRSFGTSTTGGTGALCEFGLSLELRVAGGNASAELVEIVAMKNIYKLIGGGNPESVVDALLADASLMGAIQTLQIGGASTPEWYAADETPSARRWLQSTIALTILARR
jgi:hypothetical protein